MRSRSGVFYQAPARPPSTLFVRAKRKDGGYDGIVTMYYAIFAACLRNRRPGI